MSQFLKRIGILIVLFITLSSLLAAGSLWSLRRSSFYKPAFVSNAVAEQSFDYVIIGSSTGLTTLNTKAIDSITGYQGINLSMDDSGMSSHYLMLQHFLSEGKKANYVILSPNITTYNQEKSVFSNNDYRFLMFVNRPYVYEYYSGFQNKPAKLLRYSKWLPSLGVSYYNTELFFPSGLTILKPQRRNRFDDRGNYAYPNTSGIEKKTGKVMEKSLRFNNEYFHKIKALCDAHNLQLICYLPPVYNSSYQEEVDDDSFRVINHSAYLEDAAYFYDGFHVNLKGRRLINEAFANDFKLISQ